MRLKQPLPTKTGSKQENGEGWPLGGHSQLRRVDGTRHPVIRSPSRGMKFLILNHRWLASISIQGKGYWSKYKDNIRSREPKAVGYRHGQPSCNSCIRNGAKCNALYSFRFSRFAQEEGHVFWAAHCFHMPPPGPAL